MFFGFDYRNGWIAGTRRDISRFQVQKMQEETMFENERMDVKDFGRLGLNQKGRPIYMYMDSDYIKAMRIKTIRITEDQKAIIRPEKGEPKILGKGTYKTSDFGGILGKRNYSVSVIDKGPIRVGYGIAAKPRDYGESEGTCVIRFEIDERDLGNMEKLKKIRSTLDPANEHPGRFKEVCPYDIRELTYAAVHRDVEEIISKIDAGELFHMREDIENLCAAVLNRNADITGTGLRVAHLQMDLKLNEAEIKDREKNRTIGDIRRQAEVDSLYEEYGIDRDRAADANRNVRDDHDGPQDGIGGGM